MNSNPELRDKKVKLQQAGATANGALDGRLSTRANGDNANHHLWTNGRMWWVHYTIHLPNYTKRRIRHSLDTANLFIARQRRDAVLEEYATNDIPNKTGKVEIVFANVEFSVPVKFTLGRSNSGVANGKKPGRHLFTTRAAIRKLRVSAQIFASTQPSKKQPQ